MATLAGETIVSTFPLLLKIESGGIDGTMRYIQDGDATNSSVKISTAGATVLGTLTVGVNGTGGDVQLFGDTSGKHLLWDQSGDELVFVGNGTKLSFYDAAGGENISADASGVLSIAGGSEIDLTATAIDINGAVDISGTLELNDDISILQGKKILFDTASADTYIYADASNPEDLYIAADDDIILQPDDDLVIQASTTEYVRFDGANKRVGIGTSAPSTQLHVRKDVTSAEFIALNLQNYQTENDTSGSVTLQFSPDAAQINCAKITVGKDSDFSDAAASDSFMNFSTILNNGTTNVMRLSSAGFVGIGETTPTFPLHVKGRDDVSSPNYIAMFDNLSADSDSHGIIIQAGDTNHSDSDTHYIVFKESDGGAVGELDSDSGALALSDASDERLKKNIVNTATKGLEIVNGTRMVDFNWKKNDLPIKCGIIAQELQSVFPKAVKECDDEDKTLRIRKTDFIYVLVKAVQELSASNDDLKARIEVLEA